MKTYEGIYSYNSPDSAQKCLVTVTDKRIEIHLRDAQGNPRVVYWYWYNVVQGDHALHHTGQPLQTLKVPSFEFQDAVAQQMKKPRRRGVPAVAMAVGGTILVALALLAAAYFWLVPYLAGRMANALPVEYEIKFGEKAYQSMIGEFNIMPRETALADSFFQALQIPSRYPVSVTVVDEAQTNAFAVPGGHIVIFSGLLRQMQHPEELAALLAHEYSHVELRHTTRSLLQSLGTYALVSLLLGDLSGVEAVLVQNAHELKGLEYSRRLEKEADLNGLQLLHARRINGEGYIWLFGTLKKEAAAAPSEWLSSHPDLGTRIRYVQAALQGDAAAATPAALARLWEQIKTN
ncbi:hypothetical protein DLD77_09345 [Chitinophaga alhagiae]|uniref:Peptidase M48 domain-containing protein n=1 Tax=Chitinophaga alhagiae TaxID=2203219 RepID=A0ABN5LVT1_9BACT|nr:M48 family metallopeptidase [Chitinophaga alhagiae]AWO01885.1 hypothetical protein DLD77_09345 [Chitinophaga alhagiae]